MFSASENEKKSFLDVRERLSNARGKVALTDKEKRFLTSVLNAFLADELKTKLNQPMISGNPTTWVGAIFDVFVQYVERINDVQLREIMIYVKENCSKLSGVQGEKCKSYVQAMSTAEDGKKFMAELIKVFENPSVKGKMDEDTQKALRDTKERSEAMRQGARIRDLDAPTSAASEKSESAKPKQEKTEEEKKKPSSKVTTVEIIVDMSKKYGPSISTIMEKIDEVEDINAIDDKYHDYYWSNIRPRRLNNQIIKARLKLFPIDGGTILHYAVQKGNIELVKKIINRGANVNITTDLGKTPLLMATELKPENLEMVKELLKAGADVNLACRNGFTPLYNAVSHGYVASSMELIRAGARCDIKTSQGFTALDEIFRLDYYSLRDVEKIEEDLINEVIKAGVTKVSEKYLKILEGRKLAHLNEEMQKGKKEGVEEFINSKTEGEPSELLLLAVERGLLDVVKSLVEEKNANIYFENKDGYGPLAAAVRFERSEIIEYFFEKKIDLSHRNAKGQPLLETILESTKDYHMNLRLLEDYYMKYNKRGYTLLHLAIMLDKPFVAMDIMERDGNVRKYTPNKNGATPLHLAIDFGQIDLARRIVPRDNLGYITSVPVTPINAADKEGCTALHLALMGRHYDLVKEWLSYDPLSECININAKDKLGVTPFHLAVNLGQADIVQAMLSRRKLNINVADNQGFTPLDYAISKKNAQIIELLRSHGAKESEKSKLRDTKESGEAKRQGARIRDLDAPTSAASEKPESAKPKQEKTEEEKKKLGSELIEAVHSHKIDVVEKLIEKGAPVESEDNEGRTPLYWAAYYKDAAIIDLLLKHGANVDNCGSGKRSTPLITMTSATKEYDKYKKVVLDIVEKLISHGANVDAQIFPGGHTALILAAKTNRYDVAKALITHGANVNILDGYGDTALICAAQEGAYDIAKALVENGAEVNARDDAGFTPLIWAISRKNWDIAEFLIKEGADVNIADNHKRTALHYAVSQNNADIVKLLVDKGAMVDAKDDNNQTPLKIAEQLKNKKILNLLMKGNRKG